MSCVIQSWEHIPNLIHRVTENSPTNVSASILPLLCKCQWWCSSIVQVYTPAVPPDCVPGEKIIIAAFFLYFADGSEFALLPVYAVQGNDGMVMQSRSLTFLLIKRSAHNCTGAVFCCSLPVRVANCMWKKHGTPQCCGGSENVVFLCHFFLFYSYSIQFLAF